MISQEMAALDEVRTALVLSLHARFKRIQARQFAPFRVLRYRLILRKIKIALGEK